MDREDRDRLVRIETILSESIVPQLQSYGPRIRKLERFAIVATAVWSGICIIGYVVKDTAAGWVKRKVLGAQ